jgi:hypothetical protein
VAVTKEGTVKRCAWLLLFLMFLNGGPVVAGEWVGSAHAPPHRFDLSFVPLYYDYAEELTPPLKSTEYGWLPGLAVGYTYWGDEIPIYALLSYDYAAGDLTYDGSVQDQFGQVYPYRSSSPAGISKLQVRAGYVFKRIGGTGLDLAAYSGYGYHFWSRDIGGGPPTGYLEEYSWSYLPVGVDAEWWFGGRWSIGLDLAARFMVSGSIYIERPDFGNPTLTLGNEPGWMASLPVSFSIKKNWALVVEFGYESSAIGESNPSPPDQNGNYIIEPSSSTKQFWILMGTRFQL